MVRPGSKIRAEVLVLEGAGRRRRPDTLAVEEPLEIRLAAGRTRRRVAVTMRTPGADFELAAGFLFAEGVIASRDDLLRISYCVDRSLDEEQRYNVVLAELRCEELPDLPQLERHFTTTSACGVCGKASLEALRSQSYPSLPPGPAVAPETLYRLPDLLRAHQEVFASTGGLHAAALFDAGGALLAVREDVGRHNAVDKLLGWALMLGRLPLHEHIVLVSGRASYEILQKCMVGGVPIVCSVSAPSSLAVDVARAFGMTLVGFLRGERCCVYAGAERVATP